MKLSESWLRTFVNPQLDAQGIGDCLTMAGLELDGLEPAAPAFDGVIIGKIVEIAQHPDADKLKVCQVETGDDERSQVVCGGANARADLVVALAQVGAQLPGGMEIKRAKLRGVESSGMLCSAAELGLADSSDGILELPADVELGLSLRELFDLDDKIIEIDLTPNRADCLSYVGVARELSVLTGSELNVPAVDPVEPVNQSQMSISLADPSACPRYLSRIITGIDTQAQTPLWMEERLRRSGVRALHPVVDITNYVMLELGQPMHAFDKARISGSIHIRMAENGEKLVLLDGKETALDAQTLVIADDKGPLAMAGVMGGQDSAVTTATQDIVLESAFFDPLVIAGKARSYGLHTDSSHRFERGVDFELQRTAMERATALVLELCGGEPGPVVEACDDSNLPQIPQITLRREQIERVLGLAVPDESVEHILSGLGCEVEAKDAGWQVIPPSYRFDLRIEVDLLEELARIRGYSEIPAQSRETTIAVTPIAESSLSVIDLKHRLNSLGFQEVVTYSFVDEALQQLIAPSAELQRLANPISSELSVMRTTLIGGLLNVIQHNTRRQQPRVRVFETGMVFPSVSGQLNQVNRIAGALTASAWDEQWSTELREPDFFDLKGEVESLLEMTSLAGRVHWQSDQNDYLHPGQSARLISGEQEMGWAGQLHPSIQQELGLDMRVFLFELALEPLLDKDIPHFEPLSRYPAVRRDLAIVVDDQVSYAQIEASIQSAGSELLKEFQVFDVYKGKGVASGRKSLALSLILQDLSRTLEEQEVEASVAEILNQLNSDVGASLRE